GAKAINFGDYILKLAEGNFVVLDEETFSQLFVVKWLFVESGE
ncbi:hypothetical protein D920_01808, partial [Enterococcus faecalis 13-SD-W-01]